MEQNFRYIWLSLNDITDSEIDHLIELIGFYENNSKYLVYYLSIDLFLWQREEAPHLGKDKRDLVTNSFTEFMEIVNECKLNQILGIAYE
ncbi:hypothetical protein C0165_08185 [Moraxella catarrhalis]|nr:hypothetical protein [Moraxella catarrhalis]